MHPSAFKAGSQVTRSSDGKMWFQGFSGGASVIDPQHLPSNKIAPSVHIERITANGETYDASNRLRLPPRISDLKIDYTALSFVAPEKVQFRYQLEGQDRSWREVANDREAQYSNLRAGGLRFSRDRSQRQRRVERGRRYAPFFDRAGLLRDELVSRPMRGRCTALGLGVFIDCACINSNGASTQDWKHA